MMLRPFLCAVLLLLLSGCTPVLDKAFMKEGARDFQLGHLRETPEVFKDRLFILGGVIVGTRLLENASQIEALFIPVDRYGSLLEDVRSEGRFYAVFPRAKGILDPMVYQKGRLVTMAGTFVELKKGKIDDMEYIYPVFEIRQVHLWEDYYDYPRQVYSPYPYPYPYLSPYPSWCYNSWGRPYPCPPPWYGPIW